MAGSTKSEEIAQEIRRRVLSGDYPRGARLRQDRLAADFGVSITPVREALRVLESERLLVAEPHRGVRVAELIDVDTIRAAYVVRRLTETFAVRRAAIRLSRHDLAVLRGLLDAGDPGGDSADPQEANHAFHFYFYARCGVPGLADRIEQLWATFPWDVMLSDPGRARASHAEHRRILTAARSGDADRLVAAFERHLAAGMAALAIALGAPTDDPFDTD
ncbi:GntR family transcriptional regulator [Microlunatus ginsengisoli]|uniref:GntR family transcriptional regulator n=1 Tax=Microlunatus ginsengisoli TaxID=363863 RepID=A0ABP6ZV01_9ACTN